MNQKYTFKEAENLFQQFEGLLKQLNITIEQDTLLEKYVLIITDFIEKHRNPRLRDNDKGIRDQFRQFIGLQDMLTKIFKAKDRPDFQNLIPHLKLLNKADPAQNTKTSSSDSNNNKLFELFIASMCLKLGANNLDLDSPDCSRGNNPDVMFDYENEKWAIACKALHSNNPISIFDNIKKAFDQIDRCTADTGIPILNCKNIIEHDKFWPSVEVNDGCQNDQEQDINYIPFSNVYQAANVMINDMEKIRSLSINAFDLNTNFEVSIPSLR